MAKNKKAARVIAFFNNKGGVSKTTTCFHVGWKLAELGRRVAMIDTDPQCNLTGLSLELSNSDILENTYSGIKGGNLHDSLVPVMKSTGQRLEAPKCVSVNNFDRLLLLPGSVKMAEVETQLATAMNMAGMMPVMQNIPGSFSELYSKIAEEYNVEYILIDMSPSLGAINQVNLLNVDYFIVPTMPDVFSVMAIESLAQVLPKWVSWAKKVQQMGFFSDPDIIYPFAPKVPKLLGMVVQRYRLHKGSPTRSFEKYFQDLEHAIDVKLLPVLGEADMLLERATYEEHAPKGRLAEISDYNSLIALSQTVRKPVFALNEKDLDVSGAAAETQLNKAREFNAKYMKLAESIIEMAK